MRLISFLGTEKYGETPYELGGKTEITRYIAFALSQLLELKEVYILATKEAQQTHKEGLVKAFNDNDSTLTPNFLTIPNGGTQQELWQQFSIIRNAITENNPEAVAFDITHGFRAQPFFSAAVISYLRANDTLPEEFQVFYGEFRSGDKKSPIWNVSTFVSLMDWAHALNIFIKTGAGKEVAKLAEKKKSRLFKSGEAQPASLGTLASALNDFSDDLSTIRCQNLIAGANNKEATSKRLIDMIEQSKEDVKQHLPPLIDILAELKQQVSSIYSDTLFGKNGLAAMKKLSQLYLRYNRYPESLVTLREGWVSTYADKSGKTDQQLLSQAERSKAEISFRSKESNGKTIADFRNDVQHGGFRSSPTPAKTIQQQASTLVDGFNQVNISASKPKPSKSTTYFISRHTGAIEWAKQQGIQIDEQQSHFNIEDTQPDDTIIGTLPISLIAEVCQRGGTYLHLSLDLPADMRGKELSAEDMQRYGARLEAYSAQKIAQ